MIDAFVKGFLSPDLWEFIGQMTVLGVVAILWGSIGLVALYVAGQEKGEK